jgi:2-succinyl-5-enolpyruvyl-6-hydroxy-3-cyclohexene-1-carboxylate synthase
MTDEKWIVNGYEFATREDYDKAKKEAESIVYIKAHTNMKDKQQILKIYNKASENKMFHTVIGYDFMHQLYLYLIKNEVMGKQYIKTIPVDKTASQRELPEDVEAANKLAEQYRVLYQDSKDKGKLQKIIICFLGGLILLMMVMVYFNYRTYDEDAVLDKYSAWEEELKERENAVTEKEQQWKEQQKQKEKEQKESE